MKTTLQTASNSTPPPPPLFSVVYQLFSGLLIAAALFTSPLVSAQEVSVSTLGSIDTSNNALVIQLDTGGNLQRASAFTTGAESRGYALTTASLSLSSRGGNTGDLRVAIHEADSSNLPGTRLGSTLVVDGYTINMTHEVTFATPVPLRPDTLYFIVLSAVDITPVVNSHSIRRATAGSTAVQTPSSNGWSIGDVYLKSSASIWFLSPATTKIAFSVSATIGGLIPLAAIAEQTFTFGQANSYTLPPAIGGVANLTYTLTGPSAAALPDGLSFNANTRSLSGRPATHGDTELTYTVTDGENTETQTFTLSIPPMIGSAPPDLTFFLGVALDNVTLPVVGDGVSYALTGTLPDGLTFTPSTRALSGTPTAVNDEEADVILTYTATASGNSDAENFKVVIAVLFEQVIGVQNYTIAVESEELTLPAVSLTVADSLTFAYTLTDSAGVVLDGEILAIPGLTYNPGTRILSGTPTAVTTDGVILTYTATDTSTPTDTGSQTFSININSGDNPEQVEAIVSEVARAIVSSTVSAVTSRISNVASGIAGVNVGGLSWNDSNMASALQNNAQAFASNSAAIKTLLGNSDFSLPLNAKGSGIGGINSLGIWASGEYSALSGESDVADWEGDLSGFHLGIDGKINTASGKNILVGVAVSALNGDLEYENDANATTAPFDKGNYDISMTTVSPYIGWRAGVVDLWASVGVGEGEIELTDDKTPETTNTSDAKQTSFAIGGSVMDMVVNKNYAVKLKGEVSASEFDIDESDEGGIAKATLNATRARISVEASRISDLENGRAFEKAAEIGARFDGGDGETGAGVEVGGKLKYHAANGFTAEGSARILLGHSGDYEEWGIQGTIRKQVGRDGQGLSFHLTPAYGDINSGVSQLFAQGLRDSEATDDATTTDPDYQMHLTTRLGYGIALHNANGMLTPYTEIVLGTSDQYRMGMNWKPNKIFNLTLLGEQADQNSIRLQGAINF